MAKTFFDYMFDGITKSLNNGAKNNSLTPMQKKAYKLAEKAETRAGKQRVLNILRGK